MTSESLRAAPAVLVADREVNLNLYMMLKHIESRSRDGSSSYTPCSLCCHNGRASEVVIAADVVLDSSHDGLSALHSLFWLKRTSCGEVHVNRMRVTG